MQELRAERGAPSRQKLSTERICSVYFKTRKILYPLR